MFTINKAILPALWLLLFSTCGNFLECSTSSDCDTKDICFAGRCETNKTLQVSEKNDQHAASCGRSPQRGDIKINEILFDVPDGMSGDSNHDGVRDARDDEFVEIVNTKKERINLAGLRIENGTRAKFAFTSTCLKARGSVVVFGGGSSSLSNALISNRAFGFSNSGGIVRLVFDGEEIDSVLYSPLGPASIVRSPEISGQVFRQHGPTLFSPGFCANGRAIESGCF